MSTARSTPNIALIKYWGNRNDKLRLCANHNVAMTLNTPSVDVTVKPSDQFSVTSKNKEMTERDIQRFQRTYQLIQQYLHTISNIKYQIPNTISIEIDSAIPPAIGLASSAAVFSALAKAISGLISEPRAGTPGPRAGTPALGDEIIDIPQSGSSARGEGSSARGLTDEQISIMARLGSGSAARSIFGGFGAIKNLEGDSIDSAVGWQVADENHWNLHDIIVVPSTEEKKVGSTEGHASAWTSPDYEQRVKDINEHRQQECIDAILQKDFEKLQHVAEQDAMNMHSCMQTQDPPLQYLNDETYRILDEVKALREAQHIPVLYTMDAGPTVHLFTTDEGREAIADFANAQKGCKVFEASVGRGAYLV